MKRFSQFIGILFLAGCATAAPLTSTQANATNPMMEGQTTGIPSPPPSSRTQIQATASPASDIGPTMPAPTGEITLNVATARLGATNSLAVDGATVFLGAGTHLLIVDASNPASPQVIAQSPELPGVVHALVVQDKTAYVAAGLSIVIVDISDPAYIMSSVELPGVPLALALRDNVLFAGGFVPASVASEVVEDTGGMVATINVSDSYELSIMDHISVKQPIGALALAGDILFANGNLIDASDPARLGEPQSRALEFTLDPQGTLNVLGDTLLLGQEHVVKALDISDPAHPKLKYRASPVGVPEAPPVDGVPIGLSVDGQTAYVLATYEGVENLNAFAMPEAITGDADFTASTRLARSGDWLYLAQHGLMIFRAQIPLQAPTGVLVVDAVRDVAIGPDAAYIVAPETAFSVRLDQAGFTASRGKIASLSLPDLNPLGVYAPDHPGILTKISLSGGQLFLNESANVISPDAIGLRVLDVSSPANIRVVRTYGAADGLPVNSIYEVAIKAPVVINNHTLRRFQNDQGQPGYKVLDLGSPGTPPLEVLTPNIMAIEDAAGSFVFASNFDFGQPLMLINTSDWTVSNRTVDIVGGIVDIAAVDGYALVATDERLLSLVSTSDPDNPHMVDQMTLPDVVFDIAIDGKYAFVTTRGDAAFGQLNAFIIENDRLRLAAVLGLPEGSVSVDAISSRVILGGGGMGVQLVKVQQ